VADVAAAVPTTAAFLAASGATATAAANIVMCDQGNTSDT